MNLEMRTRVATSFEISSSGGHRAKSSMSHNRGLLLLFGRIGRELISVGGSGRGDGAPAPNPVSWELKKIKQKIEIHSDMERFR